MMGKKLVFDRSSTKGHSCYIYEGEEDRFKLLAQYFEQGLKNNELCVLVTAEFEEDAIHSLTSHGLDTDKYVRNKSLRIFQIIPTYIQNGRFIADFMIANVSNFILSAQNEGFRGIRTAGEMNWMKDYPETSEEALSYEARVDGLISRSPDFVGLCLYQMNDHKSQLLDAVAKVHPTIIQNRTLRLSPSY